MALIEAGERVAGRGIDQLGGDLHQAGIEVARRRAGVDDVAALRRPLQEHAVAVVQRLQRALRVGADRQQLHRLRRIARDVAARPLLRPRARREQEQGQELQKHVASSSFG